MELTEEMRKELGDELLEQYDKGKSLLMDDNAVDEATDTLESTLRMADGLPEETRVTASYAELLLLYGKCLLATLREQDHDDGLLGQAAQEKVKMMGGLSENEDDGQEQQKSDQPEEPNNSKDKEEVSAGDGALDPEEPDKTPKVSDSGGGGTTDGNNEAMDSKEDEDGPKENKNEDVKDGEKEPAENDGNAEEKNEQSGEQQAEGAEAEESEDLFELAWEQLECARVIFENLGDNKVGRLAEVLETLGDFGMENDGFEQAAEDYQKAITLRLKVEDPNSRAIGGLHHSRYLALRRTEPLAAIESLKAAVALFDRRIALAKKENREDAVTEESALREEMDSEVKVFSSAVASAATAPMTGLGTTTTGFGAATSSEGVTTTGFGAAVSSDAGATAITVQPRKKQKLSPPEESKGPTEAEKSTVAKDPTEASKVEKIPQSTKEVTTSQEKTGEAMDEEGGKKT